jgi:hypothetical protein
VFYPQQRGSTARSGPLQQVATIETLSSTHGDSFLDPWSFRSINRPANNTTMSTDDRFDDEPRGGVIDSALISMDGHIVAGHRFAVKPLGDSDRS